MTHWIAFDQDTAEALLNHCSCGGLEIKAGEALSEALKLEKASMVMLPAKSTGKVLLARITRRTTVSEDAVDLEPSGFLGLSDAPVLRKPPQPAHTKKWWHRVIGGGEN